MTEHPNPTRPPVARRPNRGAAQIGTHLVAALQRHIRAVSLTVIGLALLAAPFAANRTSAEEPNMDPEGEIYEVMDLVDERFNASDVVPVQFVVEAREGNALERDVLLEWFQNTRRLLGEDDADTHLTTGRVGAADGSVDGLWSIAQVVDHELPDGLSGSTPAQVAAAVARVLDAQPAARQSLGQGSSQVGGMWQAEAFMATLLVDHTSFPDDLAERLRSGDSAAYLGVEAQEWVRTAQDILRGDELTYRTIGAGFDGGLAFTEQLSTAAPFILFAIVCIVLLVGILLRSYWAAGVVVVALACIMLLYGGILDLAGFKGGMLLGFIVPVAGIAFGVDFFIHAVERIRETRSESDSDPVDGAVRGLSAVAPALMVALASSVVAFLSNSVSGVEGIVQFGFAAAALLGVSFIVLGFVAPSALAKVELEIGGRPRSSISRRIGRALALLALATVGGVIVTMAIVAPLVGAAGTVLVAAVLIGWPLRRARRQSAKNSAAPVGAGRGARSGSKPLGSLVAGIARARVVVLPVVGVLAVLGSVGFARVSSEFDFSEFYSEESEFIEGLDLLDEHFGASAGAGEGLLLIEGDLSEPEVLARIDDLPQVISEQEHQRGVDFLARDLDGEPIVAPTIASVVRAVTESTIASASVLDETGVAISDVDGNGLADTAAQIRAIVDHASVHGVDGTDGRTVFTPDSVRTAVVADGSGFITTVRVGISSLTDDGIVGPARDVLDEIAQRFESAHPDHLDRVAVSGATLVQRDSLNSFTDAMRIAVPIAFAACVLLVALVLRSLRDSIVAVSPSLLVVVWVYGFMYVVDMSLNIVTATIAAIAIGVGLDYSTHFTMRYREELQTAVDPIEAVRRTGADTGGPLAISALSSVVGFGVMALSPMPIFATFGLLTAVMVMMSLAVSLFVLPSLLVVASTGVGTRDVRATDSDRTRSRAAVPERTAPNVRVPVDLRETSGSRRTRVETSV